MIKSFLENHFLNQFAGYLKKQKIALSKLAH